MTYLPAPTPSLPAGVPPRRRAPSSRPPTGVLLAIVLSVVMFATAVAQSASSGPDASAGAGASGVAVQSSAPVNPALEGTQWLLDIGASAALAGVDRSAPAVSPESSPIPSVPLVTLLLGFALATGSDGCNDYFAPYVLAGSAISFGSIGVSYPPRTCGPARSAIESAYATALASVTSYFLADSTLALVADAGTPVLIYRASTKPTVVGGWAVTGLLDPRRDARDARGRRCPDARLRCQRVTGRDDGLQPGVRPLRRCRRCHGELVAGRHTCRLCDRGAVDPGGAVRGRPRRGSGMDGRGRRFRACSIALARR